MQAGLWSTGTVTSVSDQRAFKNLSDMYIYAQLDFFILFSSQCAFSGNLSLSDQTYMSGETPLIEYSSENGRVNVKVK